MAEHAVFMIGEAEYKSQDSMPGVAEEVHSKYGFGTTVCVSDPLADRAPVYDFAGLDALADADLFVVYTRFRILSDENMEIVKAYLDSGRPVVGLRTATHSFRFPAGSPHEVWNRKFGIDLFGTPWRMHYGGHSSTDVSAIPEANGHPILRGVPDRFHVRSWLYHVLPLPSTCRWLLSGKCVNATDQWVENPVAWTNTHNGGRVFYTSLGHPEDFEVDSFRTLLLNGIRWAAGEELEPR